MSSKSAACFQLSRGLARYGKRGFQVILSNTGKSAKITTKLIDRGSSARALTCQVVSEPFPGSLIFLIVKTTTTIVLIVFTFLGHERLQTRIIFTIICVFVDVYALTTIPTFGSPSRCDRCLEDCRISEKCLASRNGKKGSLFSCKEAFGDNLIPRFSTGSRMSL